MFSDQGAQTKTFLLHSIFKFPIVVFSFVPITKINLPYSGLRPNTTNVLCVQGSLDPWRALGVTKNLTAGVQVLYIEGK